MDLGRADGPDTLFVFPAVLFREGKMGKFSRQGTSGSLSVRFCCFQRSGVLLGTVIQPPPVLTLLPVAQAGEAGFKHKQPRALFLLQLRQPSLRLWFPTSSHVEFGAGGT